MHGCHMLYRHSTTPQNDAMQTHQTTPQLHRGNRHGNRYFYFENPLPILNIGDAGLVLTTKLYNRRRVTVLSLGYKHSNYANRYVVAWEKG